MCGVCGIVHSDPDAQIDARQLLRMREVLEHRGPDDAGDCIAPGVGLSSRRLAVLDLSVRGRMPMATEDGRFSIVYNGEIYNHRELRSELEREGIEFRSTTDTEVLLRLYERRGADMLEQLNGMFAFGVWDALERTLFLARDRMGVKPLYYAQYDRAFYFASEEKALFAGGVPASFDPDAWPELLCFRYVAGERTAFTGVKRLLPGHTLTWRDGRIRTQRWWCLADRVRARREALPSNPTEWFRETFDDSVDVRRIADVPVGVLLSGGLDSGSVAASLASQAGRDVKSFTVRFSEEGFDEGPTARTVADQWGLEWHELLVSPDELTDRLAEASWLNDAPLAHASDIHLWAIAQHAKPHVTVLLSGEGADETLGGYVRYRPLRYPALLTPARAMVPWLAFGFQGSSRVRKLSGFLALNSIRDFVLFNACDVLPADLQQLGATSPARFSYRERIVDEAGELYPNDPMRQAMYSDQHTFLCSLLDRNDRMTMGASIECRVPFLDFRLVEGLAALPSSAICPGYESKHLLRQALGGRLPDRVKRGRKWGFGVPWKRYLRSVPSLREHVVRLPQHDIVREGPFQSQAVRDVTSRFLAGDDSLASLVTQMVLITVWHDACCYPRSTRVDSYAFASGRR
jgi:asparagine synthase (glutamine-hydrolysing)